MQSTNYVVIQGWMCNELGLKGNELLVFALIYGFSQDEVSKFCGTRKYIADTFNISRPTVDKALQGLLDKQYINKEGFDDFVNPNIYWVNFEVVKKLYKGCKDSLQGGCKESLHKNTSKQTTSKKEKVISKDITTEFSLGSIQPKRKKESLYIQCVHLIDEKVNNTADPICRIALIDWLNMLLEKYKDRGKVLYANVFKGKLNMLDKFDKKDWLEIIQYALQKGYEGFYPIPNYNTGIKSESGSRYVPHMTEEDYRQEEETLLELERKGVQTRF